MVHNNNNKKNRELGRSRTCVCSVMLCGNIHENNGRGGKLPYWQPPTRERKEERIGRRHRTITQNTKKKKRKERTGNGKKNHKVGVRAVW